MFSKRSQSAESCAQAPSPCSDDARRDHTVAIESWLASELGRSLSAVEHEELGKLMPAVYAPVAVHLAGDKIDSVLHLAQSALRIRASRSSWSTGKPDEAIQGEADTPLAVGESTHSAAPEHRIIADPAALPFASQSVDLIVASHTLDMVADPHQVLREIHQVLRPEGYLLIVGFNPISLWGLRRLLTAWRGQYPWTAGFLRLSRIKDWLRLLGFDITAGCLCHYGMPASNPTVGRRLKFLEPAGRRWWPGLGGVYVLVARKRDPGVSPVGHVKKRRRRLAPQLAVPVTRRAMTPNDNEC